MKIKKKHIFGAICVILVSVSIYCYFDSVHVYSRARLQEASNTDSSFDNSVDDKQDGLRVVKLNSEKEFDPLENKYFVVSFALKLNKPLIVGKLERFILKYDLDHPAHAGWGIGLRSSRTSTRFEIYWEDIARRGGWHVFDAVDIKAGKWYQITFLIDNRRSVSLFSRLISEDINDEHREVKFLGGYDLSTINFIPSEYPLQLRSGYANSKQEADYEMTNILIANSNKITVSLEKMLEILKQFPEKKIIEETEISIWIDKTGNDLSQKKREIPKVFAAS